MKHRIAHAKTRRLPYRAYITTDLGSPLRSRSFASRAEAERWAITEMYRLQNPRNPDVTDRAKTRAFSAVVDEYLRDDEPGGGAALSRAQQSQATWWRNHFGETPLTDIAKDDLKQALRQYVDGKCTRYCARTGQMVEHSRPRRPASRNRMLAAIRRIYNYCVERDWLSCPPKATIAHQIRNLPEDNQRKRGLTQAQVTALLQEARTSDWDRLYLFLLGLATTGARKMEWLGMTWDRIDFEARTAFIPGTMTKNGQEKTLCLAEPVIEELLLVRTESERFGCRPVFPSPVKPDQPIDPRRYWNKVRVKIGFDGAMGDANYLRMHDLRHTVGSFLAANGYSAFQIRDYLGHKHLASTARYVHGDEASKRAIADTLFGTM